MAEQPKYLQVADTLRKEIAEGVFRDGQTLLTEEELRFTLMYPARQSGRQLRFWRRTVWWTGAAEAVPMYATGRAGGCREQFMWE